MKPLLLAAMLTCALSLSPVLVQAQDPPGPGAEHQGPGHVGGHFADGHGRWIEHDGWHGDLRNFDHRHWEGGHWWHGHYAGRLGWWWIVGPDWYRYPEAVYPYPQPLIPPGQAPGFWYWCEAYQQYYPYVGDCPSGWQAVPPQ
jgi:hypothetical protein